METAIFTAIICPKQSLIDKRNSAQDVKILIRLHLKGPLNMKPLLSVYLKLIEWKVLSKVAAVQVIHDFVKITPLIRNVDDQLTQCKHAFDICFKVAI